MAWKPYPPTSGYGNQEFYIKKNKRECNKSLFFVFLSRSLAQVHASTGISIVCALQRATIREHSFFLLSWTYVVKRLTIIASLGRKDILLGHPFMNLRRFDVSANFSIDGYMPSAQTNWPTLPFLIVGSNVNKWHNIRLEDTDRDLKTLTFMLRDACNLLASMQNHNTRK
jgi:hypothetical protein